MAYIHCNWKNNALLMRFKGRMTVEKAGKIKKGLITLYEKKAKAYYADLSEITEIDITFIQLLKSFDLKIKDTGARLFILKSKLGKKLTEDLKTIGIDIGSLFSFLEGNDAFSE